MTNWDKITGSKAIQLAIRNSIARPGTFSATAIKWNSHGEAPLSVKIYGSVMCGYCGSRNTFSVEAMTSQVPCTGCGSIYQLFNTATEIDGNNGRIIVASIYSHRQGTEIVLPQLDINDVSNDDLSLVEQEPTNPSLEENVVSREGGTRYSVSSVGVIVDNTTGLEWLVGPDKNVNWNQANVWVNGCNIAGGGWRMPSRLELKGLFTKGLGEYNMDPVFKTSGTWVWAEPRDETSAWYFGFYAGVELWNFRDGNNYYSFRVFGVRSFSRE